MKKLLPFALCAILLAACDSFNEESDEFTIPPKPGDVTFAAALGSDVSGPGNLNPADFGFGWQAGDEIGVALDDASGMQPFVVGEVNADGKALLEGGLKRRELYGAPYQSPGSGFHGRGNLGGTR